MRYFQLLILLFPLTSWAHESAVVLYTVEISNINTASQYSYYGKLIKMIEKAVEHKLDVRFFPYQRSMNNFEKNKDSCFFPFSKVEQKDHSRFLFSKPLAELELFAISLKENPMIRNLNSGKSETKIGLKSFYRASFNFPESFKVYYVEDDSQLFEMLDRKRVDYILESVPDVYLQFKSKEEFDKKYHFTQEYKQKILKDHFACHRENNEAQELINKVNKSL